MVKTRSQTLSPLLNLIQTLRKQNNSIRKIAKMIRKPYSFVYRIVNPIKVEDKKSKINKRSLINDYLGRRILRFINKNPCVEIKSILDKLNLKFHPQTLKRFLIKNSFCYKKIKFTPYLSPIQKEKRIEFAIKHFKQDNYFDYVIFSDEKKFNLKGPDNLMKIWQEKDKKGNNNNIKLLKKYQTTESIMIFGAFCVKGPVSLIRVTTTINSIEYQNLFLNEIFNDINKYYNSKQYVWQQDNAPAHVSKSSMAFFKKHKVTVMKWPPNSPDLNPMENLWAILSDKVYKVRKIFESKEILWKTIVSEWNKIPQSVYENLIKSMDNRLERVITGRGDIIE